MLEVRVATNDELAACLDVRRKVFIDEQDVPPELEVDGLDPGATHLIARLGRRVVGTARLRQLSDYTKVERVAVLREARGHGIGVALMRAAEARVESEGGGDIVLDAQVPVVPFYEGLGYTAEGPEFLDANIPHRRMRRFASGGDSR